MIVSFSRAVEILKSGDILGLPTETVYGLAARIDSESGVKKIFTTKERPFFDPLIVHVCNLSQAKLVSSIWPNVCDVLASKFWPGPLTIVLPKSNVVSDMITSGLPSVGIRMPNHPIALKLIESVGVPLAAPSANKFGRTSPTRAEHVDMEFGQKIPVLDGGPCEVGIESTVLLVQPESLSISILREGHISRQQIEKTLQNNNINFIYREAASKKESPGHMKHHYMPSVPFVLCLNEPKSMEALIHAVKSQLDKLPNEIEGVQIIKPSELKNIQQLLLPTDASLAARQLYAEMRRCSEKHIDLLYYIVPENFQSESWTAIRDRMTKAASLVIKF